MEDPLVTQTHDGSAKLWDVWVRYWPTKAEIRKGFQLGREECVTSKKGKYNPLPQHEAMELAAELRKNKAYQEVTIKEVL